MELETFLQIVGGFSIAGVLGLIAAWYAFPPNLSVEEVRDKTASNFESRLCIRNIGRLPAYHLIADVSGMNLVIGGATFKNLSTEDCGVPISRLSAGDKTEIPAVPHVGITAGGAVRSCNYDLVLKYQMRLLWFKKVLRKKWHIELRQVGNEFVWQVSMR